jgi:hypothetical protein
VTEILAPGESVEAGIPGLDVDVGCVSTGEVVDESAQTGVDEGLAEEFKFDLG